MFGDTELDKLFNLIIIIGKKLIYQDRGKRQPYYMIHERLVEIEGESDEIYAIQSDKIEIYEKSRKIYNTTIFVS